MTVKKKNSPTVRSIQRNTDNWSIGLREQPKNTAPVKIVTSQNSTTDYEWFKLILTNPIKHNCENEPEDASDEIEKCRKNGRSIYVYGGITYIIEFKTDVWFNRKCDAVKINKKTWEITPLSKLEKKKPVIFKELENEDSVHITS